MPLSLGMLRLFDRQCNDVVAWQNSPLLLILSCRPVASGLPYLYVLVNRAQDYSEPGDQTPICLWCTYTVHTVSHQHSDSSLTSSVRDPLPPPTPSSSSCPPLLSRTTLAIHLRKQSRFPPCVPGAALARLCSGLPTSYFSTVRAACRGCAIGGKHRINHTRR